MKQLDFQGDFREFLNHMRTNQDFFFNSEVSTDTTKY